MMNLNGCFFICSVLLHFYLFIYLFIEMYIYDHNLNFKEVKMILLASVAKHVQLHMYQIEKSGCSSRRIQC